MHVRDVSPRDWHSAYAATYLERDVRQLLDVRDLSLFQKFLRACAARCGQLLNLSALGADLGLSHSTARQWLSVLEAGYVVQLLYPFHRNFGKRLVKAPKLYFADTGLAAWLLGIRTAAELDVHPMRGALFETWMVGELRKHLSNLGEAGHLWFWRDSAGHEIDLVVELGEKLIGIEAKSGQTLGSDAASGLTRWADMTGSRPARNAAADNDTAKNWLVFGGEGDYMRGAIRTVGWRQFPKAVQGALQL